MIFYALKKVLICCFLLLLSGLIFAQENKKDVSIGIGTEIGGGVFLIIPHVESMIQVPVDFNNRFKLVPKIGYTYMFRVLDTAHSNNFLPIGIDFILKEYHIGFSLMYFFSFKNISSEGIITAAITGYVPLFSGKNINLELLFHFGPAFMFNPARELKIYPFLQPGIAFQYFFR